METILSRYNALRSSPSDINEHLPTLRKYAAQCTSVAEMGVRSVVSTWALIAGLAGGAPSSGGAHRSLWCVDIEHVDVSAAQLAAAAVGVQVDFHQCDSAAPNALLHTVDMLFIDTLHVYEHLRRELEAHHGKVDKYIVMHDTEVDGYEGEAIRNSKYDAENWSPTAIARKTGYSVDGVSKGLKPAVNEFLALHPEWELHERFANNNGLTVLKRLRA